jgi:hypothetical protein
VATNPANETAREDAASAAGAPREADWSSKAQRWLFATTIFLGAFLLFLIEPLFAKLILP